jgi:glutaryl-CoA dehydrogenase (non-decarboxylating)
MEPAARTAVDELERAPQACGLGAQHGAPERCQLMVRLALVGRSGCNACDQLFVAEFAKEPIERPRTEQRRARHGGVDGVDDVDAGERSVGQRGQYREGGWSKRQVLAEVSLRRLHSKLNYLQYRRYVNRRHRTSPIEQDRASALALRYNGPFHTFLKDGLMMDFDLTEEQRILEHTVREWAAKEVSPKIRELDREHRFDKNILPQMAQMGLLGCSVPQEYSGAGMDYISLGIIIEELEYVDTSLRVIMSVHAGLNCLSLLTWGTEDQKQRYLVPQAKGQKIATYGLTEPAAGSDVRGIQTTAVKKGERYYLTGEKMWISLADVADNFLVFAWTDVEKKKQRDPSGISAFIIERAFKGFSSGTLKEKWGILAGNTGFFTMEDVEVPEENVLGRIGEGFKIAMFALDQGRYTVAAGATGLIRACRDASVKYAKDRHTFGVPIAEHQLVKEMIAQMESDYQAARLLWLRAGSLKNAGRRNTRETGLAKWFATVASERAAGDCVQVHGANGYSDEYPAGRFYRNCKGAVIYEGTREIHKLMQADYVLGYRQDRPTRCELPPYRG